MYEQLTLFVVAALPVSGTIIAVAIVVLALVVLIGGFLVYRSGGKKSAKAATGAGTGDWQRQAQQGNPTGNWSPQGAGNDVPQWSQQGQGQQGGGWGGQINPQQMQQPAWGAPQNGPLQQQTASPWGTQNGMQQPANNPWGDGQAGMTQQPAWGAPQNGQQAGNSWAADNPGMQPAPVNQRDAQGSSTSLGGPGGRASWQANSAPAAQDPWSKQPSAAAAQPQWGGQAGVAPQAQQAPTAFSGGPGSGQAWNQPGFGGMGQNGQGGQNMQGGPTSDAWGTPQPQYAPQSANNAMGGFADAIGSVPQAPSWQQQSGFGQADAGTQQNQGFGALDGDKTMMRPQAGSLGLVRVEEGKEPGREYKIVKESLSIGRSRESDIFLEDLAVSRLHASVVNLGNGQYALKDEGSANGTKVNGQLVNKFQTFPLQEGDRIQLGQTVLVFARS